VHRYPAAGVDDERHTREPQPHHPRRGVAEDGRFRGEQHDGEHFEQHHDVQNELPRAALEPGIVLPAGMRHPDGAGTERGGGDEGVEPGQAGKARQREEQRILGQEPPEQEAERAPELAPERHVDLHADLEEEQDKADLPGLPDHVGHIRLKEGADDQPEADERGIRQRRPSEPRTDFGDGHDQQQQQDEKFDAGHVARGSRGALRSATPFVCRVGGGGPFPGRIPSLLVAAIILRQRQKMDRGEAFAGRVKTNR
jgi:hypothetical protein